VNNKTPETLKRLAQAEATGERYGHALAPELLDHVCAWEADIQKGANIATELARQLRIAEDRIKALEKAICEELCECGWFESPERAAHDEDCPYALFMAALAKEKP
jgi:hypothetical protein